MIVRDEQDVLNRCLDSIQNLVDEIIIIDTGSTDCTKEIAYQYTDLVFDFQWTDDFSEARNKALSYATRDYILVMDADEYIELAYHSHLLEFLKSLPKDIAHALIVPIYNFVGASNSGNFNQIEAVRIFSNHPHIKYERPIHEQVICTQGNLEFITFDFPIYHTGYTTETLELKQKSQRNLKIFEHVKANKQLDYYDNYTLANEYFAINDYPLALHHYTIAYQSHVYEKSWMPQCIAQMLHCFYSLKRFSDMYLLCEHAIAQWPSACDFYWFKGHLLMELGADEHAIQTLLQCIQIAERSTSSQNWLISPNYGSSLPYQLLSLLYLRQHDIENAVHALTKLLYLNPNNQGVLLRLLPLLIQNESVEHVITFLNRIYDQPEDYQLVMLLETSLLLDCVELSQYYWDLCEHLEFQDRPELPFYYAVIMNNDELVRKYEPVEEGSTTTTQLLEKGTVLKAFLIENESNLSTTEQEKATLLISLFRLGKYELYDTLMNKLEYNQPSIINALADYFFDHQLIVLAINYYSILLDNGQINLSGVQNISRYYMRQNLKEAADFIINCMKLHPDSLSLYILYFLSSEHPEHEMIQQFYHLFPDSVQLPFVPSDYNNN